MKFVTLLILLTLSTTIIADAFSTSSKGIPASTAAVQKNKGKALDIKFPPLDPDKLKWCSESEIPAEHIPMIDISKINTEEELKQFLCDIRKSGLFYIVNHGVKEEVPIAAYNNFRRFMSITTEDERMQYYTDPTFRNGGYVPFQGSSIQGGNLGKIQKDHVVKYFWRGAHVVNRAIDNEFVLAFDRHHEETSKVAAMVMSKIMAALKTRFPDFQEDDFEGAIDKKRMFFNNRIYPQTDPSDEEDLDHRLVPHLDTSFITLANQIPADNEFQGLFIITGDGEKVSVPPVRNAYLVFIGQGLSFLTKNYLPSALHGVDKPPLRLWEGSERSSLISFYEPPERLVPSPHIHPNQGETTDSCPFYEGVGLDINDDKVGSTWTYVKNKFCEGFYAD